MADRCECCGKEFSIINQRKHIKNHEICSLCAARLDMSDVESSVKKIKEETAAATEKEKRSKEAAEAAQREAEEKIDRRNKIYANLAYLKQSFLETSGFNFEGYKIVKYLDVMSGQVVLGTGFLSEFSAGVGDVFGASSTLMARKMEKAKSMALDELVVNCMACGANAVIGVDLDFMTIGSNMIVACANGTAVIIEKTE